MKALVVSGSNRGLGLELVNCFGPMFDVVINFNRSGVHVSKGNKRLDSLGLIDYLNNPSFFSLFLQDLHLSEVFLINNAGTIGESALMGDMNFKNFHENIVVNCELPFKLINSVLELKGLAYVRILNVSSGVSLNPQPGWSFYSASKSFLDSLTRSVILEQKIEGEVFRVVRCSSVNPGPLNTSMQLEIRGLSKTAFPNVSNFVHLFNKGKLREPKLVAEKIKELYITGGLFEKEFLDFNSLEWL